MRILFQTEGGIAYFPGLARPVEIDPDRLPEELAHALCQAIEDSAFFELPADLTSARRGAADMYIYTITVVEAEHHHTVRVADPVPEELQPLLGQLRAAARALRASERPRPRRDRPDQS